MPTYAVVSKFGEERHSYLMAEAKKHQPFEIVDWHTCTCRGFGEFPGSRHQANCPAMLVAIRYGNNRIQDVPHYAVSVVECKPVLAGTHIAQEGRGMKRISLILFAVAVAFLLHPFSQKMGSGAVVTSLVFAAMCAGCAFLVLWRKGIRISVGSPPRR